MGTYGTAISQDDAVADVVGFLVDRLKAGSTLDAASKAALARFREMEGDDDEAPLLWLAIASVQWKYGTVDVEVLRRVRADTTDERGLDRWREDPKLLLKRRAALSSFLARIEKPNPKPSPLPRLIGRAAPFEEGDCLSVITADGRYTAALVLKVNNSNPELGMNLVAGLDYLGSEPPDLAVFEQRKWLLKHHGKWNGAPDLCWYLPVRLRQERKRIAVVARTAIRATDPRDAEPHCGWNLLGQQILLCRGKSAQPDD
jgi:hypothetical protein